VGRGDGQAGGQVSHRNHGIILRALQSGRQCAFLFFFTNSVSDSTELPPHYTHLDFDLAFAGIDVQTVLGKRRMVEVVRMMNTQGDRSYMIKPILGRMQGVVWLIAACLGLLPPLSAQQPKLRNTLQHSYNVSSVAFRVCSIN